MKSRTGCLAVDDHVDLAPSNDEKIGRCLGTTVRSTAVSDIARLRGLAASHIDRSDIQGAWPAQAAFRTSLETNLPSALATKRSEIERGSIWAWNR